MTIFLWLLAVALILLGIAGTVLPALPGVTLVFGGILLAAWIDHFARIPGWLVAVFAARPTESVNVVTRIAADTTNFFVVAAYDRVRGVGFTPGTESLDLLPDIIGFIIEHREVHHLPFRSEKSVEVESSTSNHRVLCNRAYKHSTEGMDNTSSCSVSYHGFGALSKQISIGRPASPRKKK